MVTKTWVQILQIKISIIFTNNNYTKTPQLLELHIYPQTPQKYYYKKHRGGSMRATILP